MKFIRPIAITDASFVSSSEPESEHAVWNTTTTYAIGTRCIRGHQIWESVAASNTNKDPLLATSASFWKSAGPTNRWAMLDNVVGTRTRSTVVPTAGQPHRLVLVVAAGNVDSAGLIDIRAHRAKLEQIVGGVVVNTREEYTGDTAVLNDWYDYFHEPIEPASSVIFQGLPSYPTAQVRLTLEHETEPVYIGTSVFGRMYKIGATQYGATVGITDYSRKEINPDFGTIKVTERGYSMRINAKVEVPNNQVDQVVRVLSQIRATPVVWIGADNVYRCLITYGFYKDWTVEIPYPTFSYCSIQVEGLLQQ